jgi:LPXTG-motif cell wall-anchored protein
VQDPDEPGIAGVDVMITYYGSDGVPGGGDDVVFTVTTDATGSYSVPGLPAGRYDVAIDAASLPSGLTPSTDVDGGDPAASLVDLGLGEDRDDVDFGAVGDASLGGTVWNDVDGDGVIDPGEAGVPDVTVVVTWDGPDGPVEIPVVTDSDGVWDLPALPPGDYDVELDDTTIPPGMVPTTPTDASVTLPVGGREVVDIGIAEEVSLGSTVWIDLDGDGVPDPDEPGIQGVAVYLYDDEGNLVQVVSTNADGEYLFTGLPPGTYRVEIDPNTVPEELRPTFDRDGSADYVTVVTLIGGLSILDANFGFQEGLPVTGADLHSIMWAGIVLLLGGGALLVATRRRFVRS